MQEENVILAGGHHGMQIRSQVYNDNKAAYTDSQTALNPTPKAGGAGSGAIGGNPWDQLGGRLAVGREDMADLAAIGAADAYELDGGPVRPAGHQGHKLVSGDKRGSVQSKNLTSVRSSPNSNRRWTSTCSTRLPSFAS